MTWMVSYTALAALAAHPGLASLLAAPAAARGANSAARQRSGHRTSRRLRLSVLLLAALVPLALAAVNPHRSVALLAASMLTVALVTSRASLLAGDLGEQRRLAVELDRAVQRLRAQRDELARYAAIVDSTDDAVITTSPDGWITDWNRGAERLYGHSRPEALGQHITMILAPAHRAAFGATMARVAEHGHASIESVDVRKDGSTVHTSVTISTIHDAAGAVQAIVGISRDITERKRAEEQAQQAARQLERQARQLEQLAFHDPVTGLGNRALLRERAAAVAMRLQGTALLLLDLDGFKAVNDSLGHPAGDRLLLQVGDRLGRCVRTRDTVVRLGGDEFALLLPDSGQRTATLTAERVLTQLREPFLLDDTPVQIGGSIGVTLGTAGSDLDEMLRNADLAMYEAKAAGRDQARAYDPTMHQRAASRLQVDTDLRAAITTGQFTVYYQPIVAAASGEVSGLEALVRWDHTQRGVVPPFEFLPAAERTGLIVDLGRLVLRTACQQLVQWRRDWPNLTVAVNVSHRELLDRDFAAHVEQVLTDTGLPAHALHLEITETVLAAEDDISRALGSLTALGVEFSIDDFGTGHSSLSRLRDLPTQRLKIDKSFVGELRDDGTAVLLSSIIALAHALGRAVVAEGVETDEQRAFLTAHGCDELQGYLFSRPVPAGHVVPLLFSTRSSANQPATEEHSAFPRLVQSLLEPTRPLSNVLPALLSEPTAITGLQTTFVTEIRHDPPEQTIRYVHNSDPALQIPDGLTVDWQQTLCRRMIEDETVCETQIATRYPDVPVAAALGIQTYASIPVHDSAGVLRGTLCAASTEPTQVPDAVIELMQLFGQALTQRLPTDTNPASLAPAEPATSQPPAVHSSHQPVPVALSRSTGPTCRR